MQPAIIILVASLSLLFWATYMWLPRVVSMERWMRDNPRKPTETGGAYWSRATEAYRRGQVELGKKLDAIREKDEWRRSITTPEYRDGK